MLCLFVHSFCSVLNVFCMRLELFTSESVDYYQSLATRAIFSSQDKEGLASWPLWSVYSHVLNLYDGMLDRGSLSLCMHTIMHFKSKYQKFGKPQNANKMDKFDYGILELVYYMQA